MLKNVKAISRDPPGKFISDSDVPLIPDPWECSDFGSPTQPPPSNWQIPMESHPLLPSTGNPNALRLASTTLTPFQVLLQDWLKLGVNGGTSRVTQFQKAIALLYWQATISAANPMVNS